MKAVEARVERRRARVMGQRQDGGFRCFVYCLARSLQLSGAVRNAPLRASADNRSEGAYLDEFEVWGPTGVPSPLSAVGRLERTQQGDAVPRRANFEITDNVERRRVTTDGSHRDVIIRTARAPFSMCTKSLASAVAATASRVTRVMGGYWAGLIDGFVLTRGTSRSESETPGEKYSRTVCRLLTAARRSVKGR